MSNLDEELEENAIVPKNNNAIDEDVAMEMVDRFRERFDKINLREEEDRKKLKSAIGFLEGLVFNNTSPKVGYVEQLVSAYRVLIDSNTNSVKSLDALSKLLSAGKGTNIMVQNMQQLTPQDEVMQLLDDEED